MKVIAVAVKPEIAVLELLDIKDIYNNDLSDGAKEAIDYAITVLSFPEKLKDELMTRMCTHIDNKEYQRGLRTAMVILDALINDKEDVGY